ncbi:MAG: hypothetical protein Q9208_004422 [Pyrenodesmia sp. 3 TL-2023]
MAYIPSVLPRAPSISRIWVEPPKLPPTTQAPGPTSATLIRRKSSVGDNVVSTSGPADCDSVPPVQPQQNHPAVYASYAERIENSLESGSLSFEHPSPNHPPPRHPAPRQPPHSYPTQGFRARGHLSAGLPPAPSQQGYLLPDLLPPRQLLQSNPSPGYNAPSYSPPPQPAYPSPGPTADYHRPDYHSPSYASSGYRSSDYPALNYPSSGYRSQIPQFTAALPSAPATSRPLDGATRRPSLQIKRALEDEDDEEESTEPSENDQPKKKRKQGVQGVKENEKALIARYMKVEVDAKNGTESKWQNVADKLRAFHGIQRSGNSVKAWWSRQGRQEFGLDERKNPNGRKLVTSKQDPDERRKARERKKREATEGTREHGGS